MPEPSRYEYFKDCSAVKEQRAEAERKRDVDKAWPSGDCFSKRTWLLLIIGLVVLATFFAILSLIIVSAKVSGMYSEMKEVQDTLMLQLSQFKRNVSEEGQRNQMAGELAELKTIVFEELQKTQSNMTDLNSKLKLEMSAELQKMQGNITNMISKLKLGNFSSPECPRNWRWFNAHCYYFTTKSGSWHFAKGQCVAMDSHLVAINSATEQNFIKTEGAPERYWIGLSDSETEKIWQWEDGSDYSSTPKFWAAGEPNDAHGREDCAHIDNRGYWNDISCTTKFRWICEKSLT
ncbi:hepatic lectin-like isoform X2 [Amblyraja radiata]|uniref:hepatic lectin-like isoform X2 n=1 Tax=Amblyraja radiata TaxID=386614 RepID=UPI0014040648|nr:hepatic lectin-like isoform X2 [Amblyraja radiata]